MNRVVEPFESESSEEQGRERFTFTVFLSAAMHGILIFGLGFGVAQTASEPPTLEITLAAHQSEVAPKRADFRAQFDQQGSGDLAQDARAVAPSSPFQADLNAPTLQAATPITQPSTGQRKALEQAIVTTTQSQQAIYSDTLSLSSEGDQALTTPDSERLAIASLMARLDAQQQEYAKRPRRVILTAASTARSEDALYLDGWRRRIEAIGNLNYPDAARRERLYGSLRLLVTLLPNGTVQRTEILESSGHSVLDQAALRIVQLASPYEPFPAALREQADVVEIIRTWRFHEGNSLRSY